MSSVTTRAITTPWISLCGRAGRLAGHGIGDLANLGRMVFHLTRTILSRAWLNHATRENFVAAFYADGVQALPLALTVALVAGSAAVNLTITVLRNIDAAELVGATVVYLFFRELAPTIATAILFVRSAPAMVSHLATMRLSGAIRSLEFMGIDLYAYLVLPRTAALILANTVLAILVCFTGLLGGFFVLGFLHDMPFPSYTNALTQGLTLVDAGYLVAKPAAFGFVIATACSHKALQPRRAFDDLGPALRLVLVNLLVYLLLAEALFAGLQAVV